MTYGRLIISLDCNVFQWQRRPRYYWLAMPVMLNVGQCQHLYIALDEPMNPGPAKPVAHLPSLIDVVCLCVCVCAIRAEKKKRSPFI